MESQWEKIQQSNVFLTEAINIKIQSFKLLTQWYMTPLTLHHPFLHVGRFIYSLLVEM